MLIEKTLYEDIDKIETAIERIKQFEPPEGYFLAFSGGKDSVTIRKLADMAGVKYDAHYNVTTIDPPELIKFLNSECNRDVIFDYPREGFFKMMEEMHRFPTRNMRFCCRLLKEQSAKGRRVLTGVRWAESAKRKNRKLMETCYRGDKKKTYINPIIDWTDDDVWDFIKSHNVPYCELYDQGFTRIGCICCPASSKKKRLMELERYPKHERALRLAFNKIYKYRIENNHKMQWKSAAEMFDWWLYQPDKEDSDQGVLFE
jgi:phosphoadenosine phosphosulfate reductase